MDSNINLKQGTTIYDRVKNYDHTITTWCSKTVILSIYDKAIEFVGTGQSTCAKDDTYNESFGKALAWIRASKNIGNKVENYLIKYSCKPNSKINDIECKLTLNTKSFDNNLGKLSKDVDKLISKLEEANNKVNCKIFGEDGFIKNLTIDYAEPQSITLDKLVGKWAIRTKKCGNDESFMSEPIKIIGFYDTYIEYISEGFLYTSIHGLSGDWLDNNWKEYDGKRRLN